MRLETPRLVIRSFEPGDDEALLRVFSDPEVRRFLPPAPEPTLERMRAGVQRRMDTERDRGYALWAVQRKDTGTLIGNCALMPVEGTGPEVEIAYHYAHEAWNRGYGTAAAVACLAHGLGSIGLERIIAICFPENVGSWRVMEKAGMRYEGVASYYGLTGLKKYLADRATWSLPS
ncbi:MAG TPA: GNAT family N-acetyltransferase [Chloroflexi bacterium]|jgi:ribosomal-protein-alanine N-acetyltransferase|nr:GNAT family N-acetyltransferase [Chloroflexota bacterium]HAL26912.1 GNAT family N-acetyltransferase [Chloroflexota bacterium]